MKDGERKEKMIMAVPMFRRRSRKGKLQTPAEVESRGVSTSKSSPITAVSPVVSPVVSPNQDKSSSKADGSSRENPSKDNKDRSAKDRHRDSSATGHKSRSHHGSTRRHSRQELDPSSRSSHGPRSAENKDGGSAAVKQELLHLSLARQALEAEKGELSRLLEQREGIITELRKQMHQRDKTIQAQRAQFEEALRNSQNGKRDSSAARMAMSGGAREELQLVRDAISSLRSNFRETDPNQHTLDTLEQAIAVLIERAGGGVNGGVNGVADKSSRPSHDKRPVNGLIDSSTKVIYFTERTVTPFMSTINKRLGDIRLRDFKSMFDRPGLFRFHFKSHDPEYGMVKEEIFNDDDILPGVDGKIIAWVEEDTE